MVEESNKKEGEDTTEGSQRSGEPTPITFEPFTSEPFTSTTAEKRNLVSGIFIAALIAIAFHEAVNTIHETIHQHGIHWTLVSLMLIFFSTSLRFFIGNQLHLIDNRLLQMKGLMWFYDFGIIFLQTTMLIFLGLFISPEFRSDASIGFFQILTALYLVDILWIISQWLLGIIFASWRRRFVPWAWAILNTMLILVTGLVTWLTGDLYSNIGLLSMFLVNMIAFVTDISLIDIYQFLRNSD